MLTDRVTRVIKMDPTVFREVASDTGSMGQALTVVIVASLLSGIGRALGSTNAGGEFISGVITALVGWVLWSILTYFVGTALFQGKSSISEMMRVLGFAYAPQALNVLSFLPLIGWLFSLAAFIISIVVGIQAVRESMEFDTGKAIITVIVAGVIAAIIAVLILVAILTPLFLLAAAVGH